MYSVMWSEHCSYKSSKVHLRAFGDLPAETPIGKLLAGIGENAGVVDIGQGYAVTFKIESHNHPSYVEPYQGAATGVGGIVRDILAMGARPIGVMDPLRFGPLDEPDTARVLPGVVAGVGGYGNCLGLPNIGGEVVFDRSYLGNPLVNALCVGVLRHEDLHLAQARGVGNRVILYGAATGGDGIGGVSVLASETFDAERARASGRSVPGRRPVHGEAADRVHAGALRGRAGRRHPGPRRRRAVLRHLRAGQRRRRRHVHRARPGAAAGLHAQPGGDLDERVPGTDDGRRRAEERRGVPGHLPQVGRAGHGDRRRHRRRPAAASTGAASGSSTCRRVRSPTRDRSTSGPTPGRTGRTRCRANGVETLARPTTGEELADDAAARWSPRPTCATSPG